MGSFCGSGTQRTTTNTSQTTTPTGLSQIQNIYDQIQAASQTPFTPYGGQFTAGLSPTQQAAISNISGIAGGSPYLNSAAQYATQGASAIDPSSIQNYVNPYTQNVINATQANFNESNARQQQDVLGNAAKVGALGGNRVGVAQAELARQQKLAQDPVIANLQSNAYTQAVNSAQADRAAAQYGAGAFSGFNDAALRAAQAQLGAGGVEQGTNQAALQAQYQEFLRQQRNPYMNAAFLSQYGLPAASAMGSSTSGTQVQEKPRASPLNSILGLGTAALGLFTGNPMMALGGLGGSLGAGAYGGGSGGSTYSIGYGGLNMPVYAASGGSIGGANEFMNTVNTIRDGLRKSRGGTAHFASGGLADRFSSVEDAISSGAFDPQGANYTAFNAAPFAVSQPLVRPPVEDDEPPSFPMQAPKVALPKEIIGSDDEPALPSSALGFAPSERLPVINVEAGKDREGGGSLFGIPISDKGRMALINAGLGMMASQSPTLAGAIGEGGLAALKNYQTAQREERAEREALRKETRDQQRVDLEAKRLAQSAEQFSKTFGLSQRKEDRAEREAKDAKDRGKWQFIGQNGDGTASIFMNSITGETEERPIKIAPKTGNKPRNLSVSDINKLSEEGGKYADIKDFRETFKDAYGGYKVGGDLAIAAGRRLPESVVGKDASEAGEWWGKYYRFANVVRNELFGAALTASEQAAWLKADISPNMTPDQIRKNLKIQQDIAERGIGRKAGAMAKAGYDPEVLSKAYGVSPDQIKKYAGEGSASQPASPSAPARPATVPAGSSYSASRKQWRSPDGVLFDADGNRVNL